MRQTVRQRWRLVAVALVAGGLGLQAARRADVAPGEGPWRVGEVHFQGAAGAAPDPAHQALLQAQLTASRRPAFVRVDADDPRVEHHLMVAVRGEAPAALQLALRAEAAAGGQAGHGYRASVPLGGADPASLQQGLGEGLAVLGALRALDEAGAGRWLAVLEREEATWRAPPDVQLTPAPPAVALQLRRLALDRLVAARHPAAAAALLGVLAKGQHEAADADAQRLAMRALGGLVTLQDPRAVPALIALGERREPAFLLQVIYAVGTLGGRQAEGYLVTLAGGHPMGEVRRAAKQALAEMQRAAARKKAASGLTPA